MSEDVQVSDDDQESAAPPLPEPTTELAFGAGQAAWLAVVTVGMIVALAVSFVALFLALDDDPAVPTAGPSGPSTAVTVQASEFRFDPSTVVAAADTDVSVAVDNAGSVEHNWTVLQAGTTISDESQYDDSMAVTSFSVTPGDSGGGTINLPAGTYQVICTIAGHFSAGMEGTLEVTS